MNLIKSACISPQCGQVDWLIILNPAQEILQEKNFNVLMYQYVLLFQCPAITQLVHINHGSVVHNSYHSLITYYVSNTLLEMATNDLIYKVPLPASTDLFNIFPL